MKFEKPVPGHTSHLCLPHPLSCLRKDFPRLTLSPKSDLDCGQVGVSTLQTQTASQVLTSTSRALAITCVSRKKERTTGTEALIALNPHFSPLSLVQAIEVSRLNDSLLTSLFRNHWLYLEWRTDQPLDQPMNPRLFYSPSSAC